MVTGPLNHSEQPTGTKSFSGVPCSSTRTTRGYPNFLLVQGSQLEMQPTDNIQSIDHSFIPSMQTFSLQTTSTLPRQH